jgi:periodic tryptophan protein 2
MLRRKLTAAPSNTSYTLPAAHRRNIARIALNPRGNLLLTVDEDGHAILTNFARRVVLHHLTFSAAVTALSFSPSGRHFAIGAGRIVEVWHTPSTPDSNDEGELEFAPFVRHHRHAGHHDTVTNITWSSDSRFFLTCSKDLTARIWSLHQEEGFIPTTLAGHRQEVKAAWFSDDQETIYTVSQDGALFDWKYMGTPDAIMENGESEAAVAVNERWRISQRHYFLQNNAHLTCAAFHTKSNLLVAGFSNGIFGLYELPEFNQIHTLR